MSENRLLVLGPGPGNYEGMERPSFGDEVPAETVARARELEAALDVPGLRRLVTDLAREGIAGYDIVALGQFAGSGWDVLGADVAIGGRSALLHSELARAPEWRDRLNEHGLFSAPADANGFLAAVGGDELVVVRRLRRSAIRPDTVLWFTIGNEHNPGDAIGRFVMTIDDSNHVRLEHYSRAGDAVYTGELGPGVVDEIRAALARSTFPDVPRHQIPGGAAMRQIELVTDGEPQSATMYDGFGREAEGFKDAFAIIHSITLQLAGHGQHDTLGTPVSNIEKVA